MGDFQLGNRGVPRNFRAFNIRTIASTVYQKATAYSVSEVFEVKGCSFSDFSMQLLSGSENS